MTDLPIDDLARRPEPVTEALPMPVEALDPTRAARAAAMPHVRPLDGARGLAVALVLAYHFGVPWLQGGFLGVDLFFVLSGFLITTLLVGEGLGTGHIDFVQFWYRRARRLLPALFVLIAVIAIWATTADPVAKGPLRWDLLASLGYIANWRFILTGQSYFEAFTTASPVRHLWSLADRGTVLRRVAPGRGGRPCRRRALAAARDCGRPWPAGHRDDRLGRGDGHRLRRGGPIGGVLQHARARP